jgi:integrase
VHIRKYLIPYLGGRKLAELRPVHITDMFAAIRRERDAVRTDAMAKNAKYAAESEAINAERRAKGISRMVAPKRVAVPRPFGRSTATRVRATLSSALADALAQGEVTRNVAAQARQRKGRRDTHPQVKVCEPEQLGAFLDAIEAEGERLYPLIHVAAFAGLRRGELCGLKWWAVDLDAARITVDWQRTTAGYEVVEGEPKTSESESFVDIDAATVAVLRAWRKAQVAERLAWGAAWTDTGLVFTREDGTGWHPDTSPSGSAGWPAVTGCPRGRTCTRCGTRPRASSLPAART